MTKPELENRLQTIEAELSRLRDEFEANKKKGWRAFVGIFADDPTFDEVLAEGRKYRESTRPKSRRSPKGSNGSS